MELTGAMIRLAELNAGPAPEYHAGESGAEGRAEARFKVLVVDDERLLADTTAAILRRSGFETKTAYDGFGALDAMASFHPHCLLTDIMMPGMNGMELAIAVTKIHPNTKVVLFSGQAGIADLLAKSKGEGFEFPLLAKPVHPAKLVEGLMRAKNG